MEIYMQGVFALLLLSQNITRCSENEDGISSSGSTVSVSGEGSQSSTTGRKMGKYLNYKVVKPYHRVLAVDRLAQLIQKEEVLTTSQEFLWEDVHKYPIDKHMKYWDKFCEKLWLVLPDDIVPGYRRPVEKLCVANLFPVTTIGARGGTYYRGFKHDYDPNIHEDWAPFIADFANCDCKYVVQGNKKRGISKSRMYFFVMKIAEREYFLLTRVDNVSDRKSNSWCKLKIMDYVDLPESTDINLNL